MKKRILFAALSSAFLAGAVCFSCGLSSHPIEARAASSGATDITTSSAWHDLCLLFNDGDFSTYSPFADTYRADRRLDYFDVLAVRPYSNDLYIYCYFNNDNQEGVRFEAGKTYSAGLHAEKKSGFAITDSFPLRVVGSAYRNGTEYLVKFAADDVYPSASVGEELSFAVLNVAEGEEVHSWSIDVYYHQTFSYLDARYDITTKIWGETSNVVEVIKPMSKPMLIDTESYAGGAQLFPGGAIVGDDQPTIELFGYFFDLSVSFEKLTHLDLYYNMIEYEKEAVHRMTVYNMQTGVWSTIYWQIPEDTKFDWTKEQGNPKAYKSEYRRVDVYDDEQWHITETERSQWTGFLGLDFDHSWTTHVDKIIDLKRGISAVQDVDVRNWLLGNAKKDDGSLYQYAVFFDEELREWTGQETRSTSNVGSRTFYQNYVAHEAHGLLTMRLTETKSTGEQIEWNAFAQPVDSQPGTYKTPHEFTPNEWLIAFTKRNDQSWLKGLILGAYYVLCAALTILLGVLIANAGAYRAPVTKKRRKGDK